MMNVINVVLAILALSLVVVIHEFGHFLVARLCNMRVTHFSIGFGKALWKKKWGETTYQIAPILFGAYVQIAGLTPEEDGKKQVDPNDPRLYPNRPAWQRFLVVLAGPGINYLFAGLIFIGLNLSLGVKTVSIASVQPSSAAAQAGLLPKDEILQIDGTRVYRAEQITNKVHLSQGKTLQLQVKREEKKLFVSANARLEKDAYFLGVGLEESRKHQGTFAAIVQGICDPLEFIKMQLVGLKEIFQKKRKAEFQGPIGIVRIMKSGFQEGIVPAIGLVAILSTMLGLFNLFPLPSLDGGRLVFLGIEIVTRRRINQKIEQWVHMVGMLLLLALMILISIKDVLALFQKKS